MSKKKGNKKKFFVIGIIGLLIIAAISLVFLSGDKEIIIPVQAEKAQKRIITQVVTATGTINPVNQVKITPEVTGEIVALPVEEGDRVKKGQLLIKIKPDVYEAQKARSDASLKSAEAVLKVREAALTKDKAEYNRIKGLFEKGLASDSQLELAKASFLSSEGSYEAQKATVLQAKESLNEAVENLAKTAIFSPIDGTISQLNVELNETALGSGFSQGTHLMTVADLTEMEATVEVDENDVVLVAVGDSAKIEVDAFGERKFLGLVTQIGNSAISSSLGTQDQVVNFEVKIKLIELDKGLRPGMSCDSDIQTETKTDVISVPIQSVTARVIKNNKDKDTSDIKDKQLNDWGTEAEKPEEIVFVINNNVANYRKVEVGISNDTHIEIKDGLKEGELIVSGSYKAISKDLQDGSKVMIEGQNKKFNQTKQK